jgi:3-hydroxybutyryl-CoA dehydrogenase
MGSGIAEVCARAGKSVIVREATPELVVSGRKRIEASMGRGVAKQKLTASERDAALARVSYTTELADMADADLVIEAIVEDLDAKRATFRELDALTAEATIFASNTSSLAISDIAAATSRAERFVGLHFFNPVPVMALVEVVRTLVTTDHVFDAAIAFVKEIGKVPVAAKDNSGFVVNLLLVPPPPLLRRLVTLGRFGKKNGRGFYDWTGPEPAPLSL